jgi:hypothetical protein
LAIARASPSSFERWAAELDELLAGNAANAAREQLTLIRILEELHLLVVLSRMQRIEI